MPLIQKMNPVMIHYLIMSVTVSYKKRMSRWRKTGD